MRHLILISFLLFLWTTIFSAQCQSEKQVHIGTDRVGKILYNLSAARGPLRAPVRMAGAPSEGGARVQQLAPLGSCVQGKLWVPIPDYKGDSLMCLGVLLVLLCLGSMCSQFHAACW